MKVKEIIGLLSEYNPEAEFTYINENDKESEVHLNNICYSDDLGDSDKHDKMGATSVSLIFCQMEVG
jgi:hypothetical protein